MPKLKVLSGQDVIKILSVFGFLVVSQKSSHAKLAGITMVSAKFSRCQCIRNWIEARSGQLLGRLLGTYPKVN